MNNDVWWVGFLAALILFQIVAIPGIILRRNDYADVIWGPAFPLSAFAAVLFGTENGFTGLSLRSVVLLIVISVWAIRLFSHVGYRNIFKKTEDVRYNSWRKQWGAPALLRSWLQVFVLQPVLLYVFLLPVLLSLATAQVTTGPVFYFGLFVWVTGFLFEALGDEQLRRFKSRSENKGQLMTQGLWSWSRHPNYFCEVVQWWGVWLMVLELPEGWLTIFSPIGVTYLILKVSGVSILEDLMRKRPGFAAYEKRTSIFIPMPPKK